VNFRRQLFLAQAPLAAALVFVGATSLRTVSRLGESSKSILKDNYRSALAAQRMAAALGLMDRDTLLRSVGSVPSEPASAHRALFEAELRLQGANITETGEAAATQQLRLAWQSYLHASEAAKSADDRLAAYLGPLQQASAEVRTAAERILAMNQDAMVRKSGVAELMSQRLLLTMLVATLAALVLGLVASSVITARMVRPVLALAGVVRRFGDGDLQARVRPRGQGEIADVGREFDVMADGLERYRKSSLGELLQAQQEAQAAIDSLPDPIMILDLRGFVLNLNRAAELLLRLGPGDGAGKPVHVREPLLRERLDAIRAHVLQGRGPVAPRSLDEAVRIDLDDGPRRFLPRATALYSAEREVTGVTIVLQDVTRLVRFDELKNDLVATVAHEFRTPLTGLQMAIHMCAEGAAGPLTERQADLMTGARKDCERLQVIIDEILDLSRIQAGRIRVQASTVDARLLVSAALEKLEAAGHAAGVELSAQLPAHPVPVLADPERIDIVLANLLGNALRHSPAAGRIVATVTATGALARIEVRDSGEGVPEAYLERIFDRFFQAPSGKHGALGLGLYISREIVHAHGGTMGVETEPGRGSTFWFTLPAARSRA
jgi:two-component system, NtrC family, sensor histidine kinase KinB